MSDIGSVYDFLDTLGPDGSIAYSRGAWMQGAANAGWSFNQTYNSMVGTPLGIRRESALGVWQDIQGNISAGATAAQLPAGVTAEQALEATPPGNWTGQYVHQVTATYRSTTSPGNYVLEERTMGLKGSTLLTPEEAAEIAMGIASTPMEAGEEDRYPQASQMVSLQLTGVWYDTNPGILSAQAFG